MKCAELLLMKYAEAQGLFDCTYCLYFMDIYAWCGVKIGTNTQNLRWEK